MNGNINLQKLGISTLAVGSLIIIQSNSLTNTILSASTNSNASEIISVNTPSDSVLSGFVSGTVLAGDILTLSIYNASLPINPKVLNYTVQASDSLATIANGIAALINADADLSAQNIFATANNAVLYLTSASSDASTWKSTNSTFSNSFLKVSNDSTTLNYNSNQVNEITTISSGGGIQYNANTNKALTSALINNDVAKLRTSKTFAGHALLAAGNNQITALGVDGDLSTVSNQYQQTNSDITSAIFTFDANGNMTNDGHKSFQWDAADRLVKIIYEGTGNSSIFTYDSLGRNANIREVLNGATSSSQQYIWSGLLRCESRDQDGIVLEQFYGKGIRISSSAYYFTMDHLGSIRALSNSLGSAVASYEYDPFGRVIKTTENISSNIQFAGTFLHDASNLNLAVFRQYSSHLGRWLNRDPKEEDGGMNLMSYCGNIPISRIDPAGLYPSGTQLSYPLPGGGTAEGFVGPDGIVRFPGWQNCAGFACGESMAIMPQPGDSPSSMFEKLGYNCKSVNKLCDCDNHCPPGTDRIIVRSSSFRKKYGKGTEVDTWVDSGSGIWRGYARMEPTGNPFEPKVATPNPITVPYAHPKEYKKAYCCCRK